MTAANDGQPENVAENLDELQNYKMIYLGK